MRYASWFGRIGRALALAGTLAGFTATTQAGIFDTWNCRMPITVSGYREYEPLTNFPLLVALGTNLPGFNYKQFALANGGDLRFTDASGAVELNYEIDTWNPKGTSYVWVKIPVLQGTGSTNYFDGQWVKNWSWTAEPFIARIHSSGVKWIEYFSDGGASRFAGVGWVGADSYPIRYQHIFADEDPASGWRYSMRPGATRAWNTDGELIGTWMYTEPPLSDRQVFVRFHNGHRYAAKANGDYWANINFGVLYDANNPSLLVSNKADMLMFADFDPRTNPNPYDAPVYNTNTSPVQIIAHWGNPFTTASANATNGSMWSGNSMGGAWHMREAAAVDSKRSIAPGTPNNITVTNGRFGAGLFFNPTLSSYINFGIVSPGLSGNASYTLEGWFYRTSAGGMNICYGNNGSLQAAGLSVDGNGKFNSVHVGTDEIFDNTSFGNGQWEHVVLVHHAGDDSFSDLVYVNGVYRNSRGNSAGSGGPDHNTASCLSLPSTASLSFGKSPWGSDYCGQQTMDEIRIHRTERTINWIRASYLTATSNTTFQTYATIQGATNILYGGTNAPGAIQFASTTYSVNETSSYVDVTVQRPIGSSSNVSIHLASVGGTAVAGTDYAAVNATVNMGDEVDSATARIYIANNALVDGSRTIALQLSAPTGGSTLGSPSTATVTILDDDVTTRPEVLLSYGSLWRYNDSGSDLPGWAASAYSDSTWGMGTAPLGYNTAVPTEVVTTLSYGNDITNKHITTYFRKTIQVADPSAISSLTIKHKIDDGMVMFINGTAVPGGSYLMPGTYGYTTWATAGAPNGKPEVQFTAPASLLQAGANTIAVEVHQAGPSSSDVYLDMQIEASARATNQSFTAFNDLGWQAGQLATALTTNSPVTLPSGALVSHPAGAALPVTVTLGGTATVFPVNGGNPPAGSAADLVFGSKVDNTGYINFSGTVTLRFDNLNPTQTYSFVMYGSRHDAAYTYRWTDVRILDAVSFVNSSSAGSTITTTGQANDTTRILAANMDGKVWRYDGIQPAADGHIQFTATAGGTTSTGAYLNAFMLMTPSVVTGPTPLVVPDAWRTTYFGTTNVNVQQDPDGDGLTTEQEYIAGTSPINGGSQPHFNTIGGAGGQTLLNIPTASQRVYQVDYRTNLFTGSWQSLATISGDGSTQVITNDVSGTKRYYRFRVHLP